MTINSTWFCFACNHCRSCAFPETCHSIYRTTHEWTEAPSAVCMKCWGPNEMEKLRKDLKTLTEENKQLKERLSYYKTKVGNVMDFHNRFMKALIVLNTFHKEQLAETI